PRPPLPQPSPPLGPSRARCRLVRSLVPPCPTRPGEHRFRPPAGATAAGASRLRFPPRALPRHAPRITHRRATFCRLLLRICIWRTAVLRANLPPDLQGASMSIASPRSPLEAGAERLLCSLAGIVSARVVADRNGHLSEI